MDEFNLQLGTQLSFSAKFTLSGQGFLLQAGQAEGCRQTLE
jgi:hypothetical protein